MNIKWNAKGYTDDFQFVHKYGEDLIKLLTPADNVLLIDLGCGNGALTDNLSEKGYRVIGIDASKDMIAIAKEKHPGLDFRYGDAVTFDLEEKADIIFSNAVFHWIDNQDGLVENIASQLKPGGQLVCEFGGKGNCEKVHSSLDESFKKRGLNYPRTFYFPSIGEYTSLLEKYGLKVVYATLFDRPTEQKGSNGLEKWIQMFIKKPFENISEELGQEIINEVVNELKPILFTGEKWYVDYVRIRIKAIRAS